MTLSKLLNLYKHYKINYDLQLSKTSYSELEEKIAHEGEWLSDQELEMEKIKCPQCGLTLIFANYIDAEIKCNRCKQIIRIQKEKSEEHAQVNNVKQLPNAFLYFYR